MSLPSSLRSLRASLGNMARPLAFSAAFIAATLAPAGAQNLQKVSVAVPPSILHLPYYVALEKGFFKKAGLEIDHIATFTWLPMLISGQANFAAASADALVISASKGKPVPFVVMETRHPAVSLSVASTMPMPNLSKGYPEFLRDLKGKAVAVPNRGTGNESLIKQAFAMIGFEDGRDYSMVVLGSGANIIGGLKAKQVDVVTLWPPYAEQVWQDKSAIPLIRLDLGQGPETMWKGAGTGIAVNGDFAKSNRQAIRRMAAAIAEGNAYVREYAQHKDELLAIVAKHQAGVPDQAIVAVALETVARLAQPNVDCQAMANIAQGLLAIKAIDKVPACADMAITDALTN